MIAQKRPKSAETAPRRKKRRFTEQEYLDFENNSEDKHEYREGEIVLVRGTGRDLARLLGVSVDEVMTPQAMAGASDNHVLLNVAIAAELYTQTRKGPCRVYTHDKRVRSQAGRYVYPDVVVTCGPEDIGPDNVLNNPTLIVEVLSPSTALYDMSEKFYHYRGLGTLQDYLLVAQDEARISHYSAQPDGSWIFREVRGLDAVIALDSVGCTLALRDIYERVTFPPADEWEDEASPDATTPPADVSTE